MKVLERRPAKTVFVLEVDEDELRIIKYGVGKIKFNDASQDLGVKREDITKLHDTLMGGLR